VAADPGLPLRLRHRQAAVPVLHKMQRRWLNARVPPLAGGGTARHDGGPGREGWTTRGALRDLQAAQLALPTSVFLSRYWRRELLYYAHGHQEQYPLRAGVLVLDVSPPCFGPVEAVTRLAAHIITASLPAARLPTVMITADGMGWVMRLEEPADKLDVWTTRSLEPARAVLALRLAGILRRTLDDGNGPEPPVVVLSHAWFGAEETISAMPGLRGLFVQYPGQRVEPVLAAHCERWVIIGAHELPDLLNRLRRLLT
jgi:ATP-dependent Clp protease ATP-binding subunit ClpC